MDGLETELTPIAKADDGADCRHALERGSQDAGREEPLINLLT